MRTFFIYNNISKSCNIAQIVWIKKVRNLIQNRQLIVLEYRQLSYECATNTTTKSVLESRQQKKNSQSSDVRYPIRIQIGFQLATPAGGHDFGEGFVRNLMGVFVTVWNQSDDRRAISISIWVWEYEYEVTTVFHCSRFTPS